MEDAYQTLPYTPELRDGVVRVLRDLLGPDDDANARYFRWKYEDNPYRQATPGIVAMHDGQVVGFRGYFATRWACADQEPFLVLCPGDTCVDPAHRRQGLSVKMGRAAHGICTAGARLLVNTSSTSNSVPGYLRLGFFPLVPKTFLHRYSALGFVRFAAATKLGRPSPPDRVRYGSFGDITVADRPEPEAMARVIADAGPASPAFALVQDRAFFEWRFANMRNRYVFYFGREAGRISSYMVMRFSPGARRGYIVDYAGPRGSLSPLVGFAAKAGHADVLSVWSTGMEPEARLLFESHGFKAECALTAIERRVRGEWPVLVRPVPASPEEKDWIVNGLDVRVGANWRLREVGSDGV